MSAFDSLVAPNIARLTPYVPGKPIEELERELGIRNAVKLASNENPLGPSPKAIDAASHALASCHRYPDSYKLRAALAEHHGVAMDEIVLGNGSNELIDLAARTFGVPGGHVVYPEPSFLCYRMSSVACAMEATEVPLIEHVSYDVAKLTAAVRPDTRLVFLANPNNPTGCYLTRAELEHFLRSLPERTVAVLDEAYVDFADASDYESALALREAHLNTLVLRTFSKAYGLAGFRVGYGIAPRHVIDFLERVRAPFNVGNASLAAARAALADREHLERYLGLNQMERARLTRQLGELGLTVAPSQANFVLVDFKRPGREVYELLLRKGVIVRAMPAPISTWLRITVGLVHENERLVTAVRELMEEGR